MDVNSVARTLTGNEVGLNMNYLMDDAVIHGNNNSKTGDGIKKMGAKEFADAMRSIDPTIKIIVNGRSNWWATILLSPAAAKIDYLANGNYLSAMLSYDAYRLYSGSLNVETDEAIKSINNVDSVADKDRIGVIEAEYNSIDFTAGGWANSNNLGHALCSFQMLADGLLKRKLYNACFWNTRWIDNTTKPQDLYDVLQANGNLNAKGICMGILGNNLFNAMVSATSISRIKSYASYNVTNKKLNVFLLNKELSPKKVILNFAGYLANFTFDKWEFKGSSTYDKFPTWASVITNKAGTSTIEITLPATSVTMTACK